MLKALQQQVRSRAMTPAPFRPHLARAAREWAAGEQWRNAWAPHLARCRGLLDTMIDDIAPRHTVVVLGTGSLDGLPIEGLGRCFERVVLVDRAHLAAGLSRTRRYPQIERVWAELAFARADDLTGFIARFDAVDWVISANLLAELGESRSEAIDAHLDGLKALPCPATLISPLDYRVMNRHGVLLRGGSLLDGRDMPRSGERWKWERRPLSSPRATSREVQMVGAWADWRKT
jgi:hypothetical protein